MAAVGSWRSFRQSTATALVLALAVGDGFGGLSGGGTANELALACPAKMPNLPTDIAGFVLSRTRLAVQMLISRAIGAPGLLWLGAILGLAVHGGCLVIGGQRPADALPCRSLSCDVTQGWV